MFFQTWTQRKSSITRDFWSWKVLLRSVTLQGGYSPKYWECYAWQQRGFIVWACLSFSASLLLSAPLSWSVPSSSIFCRAHRWGSKGSKPSCVHALDNTAFTPLQVLRPQKKTQTRYWFIPDYLKKLSICHKMTGYTSLSFGFLMSESKWNCYIGQTLHCFNGVARVQVHATQYYSGTSLLGLLSEVARVVRL